MVVLPHTRTRTWLLALAIGAGCAHAPPVAEPAPVDPPLVTVAEPTCQVIQAADCGPSGDCRGVEMIGAACFRTILPGESLIEIARQYDLGYNEIESANPGLDAFVPTPGANVAIPTAWIVPRAGSSGKGARIVVNLSEMRLYVFPRTGPTMTFPVGVGSEGWTTPVGTFSVIQKQVNPPWYPPTSIRKEEPDLPAMVPPGPENPLGTHALRLSRGSILIHGTDKPFGVGRKASHGCLRLYPEDIPVLFERVPVGTQVSIVREPVKVGVRTGRVYVEIHLDEDSKIDLRAEAKRILAKRGLTGSVDPHKLEAAVVETSGVPIDVTADRS
jgi:L,D-transpeptidase ErfK/SrfK